MVESVSASCSIFKIIHIISQIESEGCNDCIANAGASGVLNDIWVLDITELAKPDWVAEAGDVYNARSQDHALETNRAVIRDQVMHI
jgi:hypothetical protein